MNEPLNDGHEKKKKKLMKNQVKIKQKRDYKKPIFINLKVQSI